MTRRTHPRNLLVLRDTGGPKQRNTPADLAEDRGAANHLTRRWLRP